tara:strand:- start:1204 stop:1716 length:513 start_codon:yes stop_codon:yes gene_type:complete
MERKNHALSPKTLFKKDAPMNKKRKIGWQKYEDVLEKQLTSPFFQQMLKNIAEVATQGGLDEEEEEYYEAVQEEAEDTLIVPIPVTEDLSSQITMMTHYDCWVGHTNFDITPSVKQTISEVKGVEVLRINSRYRFFIGIGKMFKFTNVRSDIEKRIKKKELKNETNEPED